uniref:Uncharacterized protein n=1 Tax=Oryza sativa subsp. japonica TaxID=39947 RepID=Q6YVB4_ORYSJ|nr:hypothetical protein [Oryza sativa Japonica Group]
MERRGRIWKETTAAHARVSSGGRREEDDDLTGGPHLSASEGARARAAADWTGPTWAERERKEFSAEQRLAA